MGGPGAVAWLWIIAFLGSSSAIMEATLGQMYKEVKDGQFRGGPAFYILKGLRSKLFARTFAVVTVASTGFLLPRLQSNIITLAVRSSFGLSYHLVGILLVLLLSIILIGGVKRISRVAEFAVPLMAGGYILMAMVIMFLNFEKIPEVLSLIIDSAFFRESAFGGFLGMAVSWGVKRGIYSNEAGQGTAPHAAAVAEVSHPIQQGLVQGFSVYVDTLLVCTATAFMILFTGQYNVADPEGGFLVQHLSESIQAGPEYTQLAVSTHFPSLGDGFVAIALLFFAFTTILAYYYIAETNLSFVMGEKKSILMIRALQILLLGSVYMVCISTAKTAWALGDIGVGIMAWLNMVAIIILHQRVWVLLKDYERQRKEGKKPIFQSENFGYRNVDFWKFKG